MPRPKSPEKTAVRRVDKVLSTLQEQYLNDPQEDWVYALELLLEEGQMYLQAALQDQKFLNSHGGSERENE